MKGRDERGESGRNIARNGTNCGLFRAIARALDDETADADNAVCLPPDLPDASAVLRLHPERQLAKQPQARVRALASRFLTRPRQPYQDRLVQLRPLLRKTLVVPVQHRERGQHHWIPRHAPYAGTAAHRGQQLPLVRRHGNRATSVLGEAKRLDDLGRHFGAGLTEREIEYLIKEEFATTAEDILWRRTKCGLHMTREQIDAVRSTLPS